MSDRSLGALMLRRELAITLRAPLTWVQAVLSALLTGHGFVLAIDLYSAASRSVGSNLLMARELDPLAGVVRPTLGGLALAVSVLAPLVGARAVAIERERRTLDALLVQRASRWGVAWPKFVAALAGAGLQLLAPLVLFATWLAVGGHLGGAETVVALFGHGLHLAWITAVAFAASCLTRTFAQAVATALVVVVAGWAIDAADGFAALAWLGQALRFSVSTQLELFERGVVSVGAVLFFVAATASLGALALAGLGRPRVGALTAAAVLGALAAWGAGVAPAVDASEASRRSLPPDVVARLRALPAAPRVTVELDRDDARRTQLERDFLSRLRLARPDAVVRFPPDERDATEAERADGYGRLSLDVGEGHRETTSTSRRELATLLFEAAGQPVPSFEQAEYPGYPLVLDGARRAAVIGWAWFGLPALLALVGWWLTRIPRRSP